MSTGTLRAAIIQHVTTRRVLMLGWMDDAALALTRDTGEVHFFSRSRQALWRKGEESGHVLSVREIVPDCDGDALLVKVQPQGSTCHTGSYSCFAPWLWLLIAERLRLAPPDSYVVGLVGAGVTACSEKVAEEAAELVAAARDEDDVRVVHEAADLWFHLLLLLAARGLDPAEVEDELARRRRFTGRIGAPARRDDDELRLTTSTS